jgi:hypothetical protein
MFHVGTPFLHNITIEMQQQQERKKKLERARELRTKIKKNR